MWHALSHPYETKLTRYGVHARLRGVIFTVEPNDGVAGAIWFSYPGDPASVAQQVSYLTR